MSIETSMIDLFFALRFGKRYPGRGYSTLDAKLQSFYTTYTAGRYPFIPHPRGDIGKIEARCCAIALVNTNGNGATLWPMMIPGFNAHCFPEWPRDRER